MDLASCDPACHHQSVDDLKTCVDWLALAGGRCLVAHPGGLSDPADQIARRAALADGLLALAAHASGTGVKICVENMPPGVYPGSRMADLAELIVELDRPQLALALDTGHANLTSSAAAETRTAGALLATTHVHDNDGRKDSHEPPGYGTIDWADWGSARDSVNYSGPILLECIRYLRENPGSFQSAFLREVSRGSRLRFGSQWIVGKIPGIRSVRPGLDRFDREGGCGG